MPCWMPVMQVRPRPRLARAAVPRFHVTRASELGPGELDNGPVMTEDPGSAARGSPVLGHDNFAEVSLVPKMARSPAEVAAPSRPGPPRQAPSPSATLAELRAGLPPSVWPARPAALGSALRLRKLKEERYAFSGRRSSCTSTEPKVLEGSVQAIETCSRCHPARHPPPSGTSRCASTGSSAAAGTGRRSWSGSSTSMPTRAPASAPAPGWTARAAAGFPAGWRRSAVQTPVAFPIVCNYAAPWATALPCSTHDDLITLFHEFGHGLHHLLTQVDDLAVAGISGVEWDASSCPASSWRTSAGSGRCCHASAHVETGDPLPRAL